MKQFFILLIAIMPITISAQHLELGVLAGISNYQGDLAPSSIKTSFGQTHAAFGGFVRYNVNNYVAAKFGVNYAKISGDDAVSDNSSRLKRDLSFESKVLEFGLIGEFNILGYQPYALEKVFSPYIFAGISLFKFNPTAELDGTRYDLHPLGTEGQGLEQFPDRKPYKLLDISIPMGAGVKYAINDKWNIGLELGVRMTFTDHLDDVSTTYVDDALILEANGEIAAALANRSGEPKFTDDGRGNPNNNDWYFIGGLTISYNFLDNGLVGSRGRSGKKSGCPTF